MTDIYLQLREEARKIVSQLPDPDFCRIFSEEISYSRQMLHSDPLLVRIKKEINPVIEDDFGHGMHHSDLVCVDAGAVVLSELNCKPGRNGIIESDHARRQILMVQIAGLLHDVKRKEKRHAAKGAAFAREFLSKDYPLLPEEIEIIAVAIEEHEAFQKEKKAALKSNETSSDKTPTLISNALYDGDKFRWGPDNFTHTVWDMVIFANVPLREFITRYPKGLSTLEKIKRTFRTPTGMRYGPNFIDIGIEVGNKLLKKIKKQFPDLI